jgi:hypothetical protein
VSEFPKDYDDNFFAENGIKRLKARLNANKQDFQSLPKDPESLGLQ